VRVVVSGVQEVLRVVLVPEWLRPEAAVQLQEWVREAVNSAILGSQQLAARRLEPLSGASSLQEEA
jgi:DNA-binding protein YbaB